MTSFRSTTTSQPRSRAAAKSFLLGLKQMGRWTSCRKGMSLSVSPTPIDPRSVARSFSSTRFMTFACHIVLERRDDVVDIRLIIARTIKPLLPVAHVELCDAARAPETPGYLCIIEKRAIMATIETNTTNSMAKRGSWITGQRSHSKKTKKRLEAKRLMLEAKKSKRRK